MCRMSHVVTCMTPPYTRESQVSEENSKDGTNAFSRGDFKTPKTPAPGWPDHRPLVPDELYVRPDLKEAMPPIEVGGAMPPIEVGGAYRDADKKSLKGQLESTSQAQRKAQSQVAALEKEVARLKRDTEVKATHEEIIPTADKNAATVEVRRNVDSSDRIRIVPVVLATYSRMDAAHPGLLWQHVYRAHPRRRARRQGLFSMRGLR